jgi:transcriptional regulator with XRE-family HTH domain
MTHTTFQIPSDLARAARALTQVSIEAVAAEAGLDVATARAFEQGVGSLTAEQNAKLQEALESFGAVILPEDGDAGYGVRQKYNTTKVARLENLENEGGVAADDDV